MTTVEIELEQETDGRWIAEVPALPGVLAYGSTPDDARIKVESLANQVLTDHPGHPGNTRPNRAWCSVTEWQDSRRARRLLNTLRRTGWQVKARAECYRVLAHEERPDFVFAFRYATEIGPRMTARVQRHTGLRREHFLIAWMVR